MADHSHAIDASVFQNAQGSITLTLHDRHESETHLVLAPHEALELAALLQYAAQIKPRYPETH